MGCCNQADQEKYAELKKFIDSLPTQKGELIRVLHRAQGIFGYLPREVQVFVAREMEVPVSKVYGVVSFYSYFTMKPKVWAQHAMSAERRACWRSCVKSWGSSRGRQRKTASSPCVRCVV